MRNRTGGQYGVVARIRRRIDLARLIFSLVSAVAFTAFTLIMLVKDWGNSIYLYVILGLIATYIVIFGILIGIAYAKNKNFNSSLKDYKSGLKILKAILRLISIWVTVSVFSIAIFSHTNAFFRILVLSASVVWAVFQIFYQVVKLRKRHKRQKAKLKKDPKRRYSKKLQKSPHPRDKKS